MERVTSYLCLALLASTLCGCGSSGHGSLGTGGSAAGGRSGNGGASGDAGTSCQSDLYVPWQLQDTSGAAITCGAARAATVVITIDGVSYPQPCPSGQSYGSQDIPLQANDASYDVTANVYDASGNALAVGQTVTVNVAGCSSYTTPGPATLVVATPSP